VLTGSSVKRWRKQRGMSLRGLGQALGYRGGENIKKIESGACPVNERFARRFEEYKSKVQSQEYRAHRIKSKYPLPARVTILGRARRCRVCRCWFVFANAADRVCDSRKCRV